MTIALRVLSRFVVISVSRREPGCGIAEAKCRHLQLVLDPICLILRLSKSSSTGIPVICRGYPRYAHSEWHLISGCTRLFDCARLPFFHRWRPEKLHTRRYDFGALPFATVVLCFEFPRPQTPFNVNLAPFGQILIANLREFSEGHDVMPLYAVLLLSLLVGERFIGRNR